MPEGWRIEPGRDISAKITVKGQSWEATAWLDECSLHFPARRTVLIGENGAAHRVWRQYRPRKGEAVTYKGEPAGIVGRTEGNLCWLEGTEAPFIWCFRDGLNALHRWDSKPEGTKANAPGQTVQY